MFLLNFSQVQNEKVVNLSLFFFFFKLTLIHEVSAKNIFERNEQLIFCSSEIYVESNCIQIDIIKTTCFFQCFQKNILFISNPIQKGYPIIHI